MVDELVARETQTERVVPLGEASAFLPGETSEGDTPVRIQLAQRGSLVDRRGFEPPIQPGPERRQSLVLSAGGGEVDLAGHLTVHLTRGVEVEGRYTAAVVGEDATFVYLDELHPARWRAWSLFGRFRW